MPRLTAPWQKDSHGDIRPTDYVGKQYFHPRTGTLYEVHDYGIDAERGLWLLFYRKVHAKDDVGAFTFAHTIGDFTLVGRFLEVKG